MRAILLIARRDLLGYLRTMGGYVIIAALLFILGLLFNSYGLGGAEKRSAEVLAVFFRLASACTVAVAVLLSTRLVAEEKQSGTITLLYSAPVRDVEIVLGKFLSGLGFLAIFLALSTFMPALIFVNGKVSFGHILAGYLGLLLMGAGSVAIGTLGSTLAGTQVVAVILSAVIQVAMYACLWLAHVAERPLSDLFAALAYFPHFAPFELGLVNGKDVVYYLLVSYVALFSATRVLEARRWK